MQYQFLALACLMAVVRSRRHLCDDLTLPDCTNGDKADYNPTGENRLKSKTLILESNKIFRNPPCSDGSSPTCSDGSEPIVRNNICQREEKQCPQGQGKAVSLSSSSIYSSSTNFSTFKQD